MTAAQGGDREAFGLLYERYYDVVFRFVYFRTGSKRQLAEDLTADAFVRALARIGSFTWVDRDPGAWFVTIARNLCADHFKSARFRLEITVDAGDLPEYPRPDLDPWAEVEAAAGRAEAAAAWEQVRGQLTVDQVRCLELRYAQGLSVREVCVVMDKEEGAVKAMAYRATRTAAARLRSPRPVVPAPRRPPVIPPPAPAPPPPVDPSHRWRCDSCGYTSAVAYHPGCPGWLELIDQT
jgi:RNA polymerase sigma-70 factor (ECF subfamily)